MKKGPAVMIAMVLMISSSTRGQYRHIAQVKVADNVYAFITGDPTRDYDKYSVIGQDCNRVSIDDAHDCPGAAADNIVDLSDFRARFCGEDPSRLWAFENYFRGLTLCAAIRTLGQEGEPQMEWGEVPLEHLKMTSFPDDTNAPAVILFDVGNVTFNDEYDLVYTRHTRVKLLKKAGFDWATHKIQYYAEDGRQRIKDLEGQTITLQPDGEVVIHELDDDAIFEEDRGGGWERTNFTLPGLSEGCVIEWRYTLVSTSPLYMPNWDFQHTEPALWSEFRYKTPRFIQYISVIQGYEQFFIKSSEDSRETFMGRGIARMVDVRNVRFVIKDVPAMREEPYITTLDDYKTRLLMQLYVVQWPGAAPQRFLQTWEKLVEEFLDHKDFGKQLHGFSAIRKQAEAIVAGMETPVQKIKALYDFTRTTVVWDETNRIFADRDIDELLENKSGSSAEMNLLLTSLLREAGIKADPVMLSTRSNGKIQKLYPMYDQFNYIVCRAQVGKKAYYLDATDKYRPYTMLPRRVLNYTGLVMAPGPTTWAEIPSGKANSAVLVSLDVAEDGSLSGSVQMKFVDYGALDQRKALAGEKEEEYVKALLRSESMGLSIDSFSIANKDSIDDPLRVDTKISSSSYCQTLDDNIYINPVIVFRLEKNPFMLARRTFPVDFATGTVETYSLTINIPKEYTLKEYPQRVLYSLPRGTGSFLRETGLQDGRFKMTLKLTINQAEFDPRDYQTLRSFYEKIVAAEAEMLVLEKITKLGSH